MIPGLEKLAADYLRGLTPDQIRAELPKWLSKLDAAQFDAAMDAADAEAARRGSSPAAAAIPSVPFPQTFPGAGPSRWPAASKPHHPRLTDPKCF